MFNFSFVVCGADNIGLEFGAVIGVAGLISSSHLLGRYLESCLV